MMILAALTASAKVKGDWKGKVVDEQGRPIEYANVAVLSKADSTVLCGTVTAEDGTFNIVTKENDGIMMVAILGYQTVYLAPVDGAVITLREDASLLESAVATAVMPKTKLTGEGLQTNIRGSVLENAGTAKDVLSKTPGLIKGQNGLEVIGKGAPLVYINGHRLTDATELDRLQSNEIQSIEVITNPGAQYDATVRAVVRIKTIKRQGEGFGFNLYASDSQSLNWKEHNDPTANLNVNYRTGGVDLFAGINYTRFSFRQDSDIEKNTFGNGFRFKEEGSLWAVTREDNLHGNAGINWQIADNHFVGAKVEWGRPLSRYSCTEIYDELYENGTLTDKLTTTTEDRFGDTTPYSLGANIYYNGLVGGKLGVDLNLDYYGSGLSTVSLARETSTMTHDAEVHSNSDNSSRLYAGKLVLSCPVGPGQLQFGTEETFSRRKDIYAITGIGIPASSAFIREDNYAGFVSYGAMLGRLGVLNAGVRYEYVHYSYEDAVTPANNLQRDYGNWFPTFSYATAFGPVQMMLNYSAKTRRPSYANLSSAIRYNSRYTWQSGNAMLQPELSHDVSLTAVWSFITFVLDYVRTDNAIMTWSSPYGDEGVVLVQPRNIDAPYRAMSALVVLSPTIGPWTMNYTLGVQPQWLSINVADPREPSGIRVTKFNGKPIFFAQLQNTFTVKGGWQFELGATIQSTGYSGNMYVKNAYCDVSAAIQKTLLRDGSLVLRLEGADLLGLARYNVDSDFGSHTIYQTNRFDNQRIKFSLRFNFNTAQSKYKGTGAGKDTRDRM
jgi:hypothetical protein